MNIEHAYSNNWAPAMCQALYKASYQELSLLRAEV